MSENKDNGGIGCIEVGLIVLFVLWVVGYWDRPKTDEAKNNTPAAEKADK